MQFVGWLLSAPPALSLSYRSDYCGLFTKPASTTCSHSTPPASDKLSSLQIETNDLPLPRSPTAQLFVHVSVCMCVFKRERKRERREGGDKKKYKLSREGVLLSDYKMLLKWITFIPLHSESFGFLGESTKISKTRSVADEFFSQTFFFWVCKV